MCKGIVCKFSSIQIYDPISVINALDGKKEFRFKNVLEVVDDLSCPGCNKCKNLRDDFLNAKHIIGIEKARPKHLYHIYYYNSRSLILRPYSLHVKKEKTMDMQGIGKAFTSYVFGNGCEHKIVKRDANNDIVFSYCKHKDNPDDCEGNCSEAKCPLKAINWFGRGCQWCRPNWFWFDYNTKDTATYTPPDIKRCINVHNITGICSSDNCPKDV